MKNRINNDQPERSQVPCNCGFPLAVRTRDVAVSKRRKNNGYYSIDRYFDCILCGPHVTRAQVLEIDESDPWRKKPK